MTSAKIRLLISDLDLNKLFTEELSSPIEITIHSKRYIAAQVLSHLHQPIRLAIKTFTRYSHPKNEKILVHWVRSIDFYLHLYARRPLKPRGWGRDSHIKRPECSSTF